MHEPDGVRGVNALRREEPSLQEQILEHESIGLLRDATACYDRAIQLESDQVPKHMQSINMYLSKCIELLPCDRLISYLHLKELTCLINW